MQKSLLSIYHSFIQYLRMIFGGVKVLLNGQMLVKRNLCFGVTINRMFLLI